MRVQKRKRRAVVAPIILALLVVSVLPFVSGCFSTPLKSMAFKNAQMTLALGETYCVTMSDMNFQPAMASNKEFTLNSSDENVVRVVGNALTATGTGTAEITATSSYDFRIYASCSVSVGYADPSSLAIKIDGEKAQYVGATAAVRFTVTADVDLDPENEYVWKLNGKTVLGEQGKEFVFTPKDEAGEYNVSCELESFQLTASAAVRVFSERVSDASATYSGELVQDGDYGAVTFRADWTGADGDPEPFVEWFVNGEAYALGKTFNFTPSFAGSFAVSVTVNGDPVALDGSDSVTVVAKGSVVPTNVSAAFNNIYPNIRISWSCPHTENMNYQLKIENLSTGRVEENLTSTNASAAALFDGTSFAAGSVLDIERYSYRISVRSLGDGAIYLPSSYSAPVTVGRLSAVAVGYLKNKVLSGTIDHYVVSDEEFAELMSYYMAFRKDSKTFKFDVYMGYSSLLNAKQLGETAFDYGATTGSYSTSFTGDTRNGGIVSVKITCDNSVNPSKTGGDGSYSGLNAIEPHVAKDSKRDSKHIFAIDNISVSQRVDNSEELFRTVEMGVKPVPSSGSNAEKVYAFARLLLTEIISDDMTDAEKVHAIYDWIMWNVQYDHEAASSSSAKESALYKAYFLEGVLTNQSPYAVCDGMSKALSLLCRMEGIEAYRVTGKAGDSTAGLNTVAAQQVRESWGGHAWNKVKVEGKWYVVDATWGDAATSIRNSAFRTVTVEMALHDWLLVTDDDIADTHAYDNNIHNPDTAYERYGIYEKIKTSYVSGSETRAVDAYISSSGEAMSEEIADMMECLSYLKKTASRTVKIYNKEVPRSYIAMDISASDNMMKAFMNAANAPSSSNPFKRALARLGYNENDYILKVFDDCVVVILKL